MKKFTIVAIFIIAAYIAYSIYLIYSENLPLQVDGYKVLIIYNKADRYKASYDIDAYQSVLTEEGVPWQSVEIFKLIKTPVGKISKNIPAIIFPDRFLQHMPEESVEWVKDYLAHGGNVAVIYDPGVKKGRKGNMYRDRGLLSDIVGLNYITFKPYEEKSYTLGRIQFKTKSDADYFEVPRGKLTDRFVLSGYFYGEMKYPVARTQNIDLAGSGTVFAEALTDDGERYPAIMLNPYSQGKVLYANMPLGYLKAYSDDLPLRAFLRTFLFQIVKMPHLVNTYQGGGKLVINWHVDSNGEWKNLPTVISHKYLDRELRASIHITAGDFRDTLGDYYGFDACGGGRKYAEQYLPYGVIGSQGGWAHNWFAEKLKKNRLWTYEIRRYIKKNKNCLGSISGYLVTEYSPPLGVHPQPVTTKVLEKLGFNSYSYMGDGGSAPNRTFSDGKMVSEKVMAFPVMPNGKYVSLYEMKKAGMTEEDVEQWLKDLVDYVVKNRTTRLFRAQINDIFNYPRAVGNFLQYAKLRQARGELQIAPMSEIAFFSLQLIKTQCSIKHQGKDLSIMLRNKEGLRGMTVAVPKHIYQVKAEKNVYQSEDKNYYYLTVQEDVKEKVILAYGR